MLKSNKIISLTIVFCILFLLCACKNNTTNDTGALISTQQADGPGNDTANIETPTYTDEEMFSDRDKNAGYEKATSAQITISNDGIASSFPGVKIDGKNATITEEYTYIISGTGSDIQIVVDAVDTAKIQLVLDGVDFSCTDSAPIYIKNADKVFITLADESVNSLKTSAEFSDETNVDGVIFSKSDLTLNGNGTLNISSKGNGIVCKDDLVVTGGEYKIDASNHGIDGKDSIRVFDGTLSVTAGKDGLHSDNTEKTDKGFVYIKNGTFDIICDGDGIDAVNSISIKGGKFNIKTGGGAENAEKKSDEFGFGGFFREEQTTTSNTPSCKGIKSDKSMLFSGGEFNINSADDTIHGGGDIVIENGKFVLSTGDDGIHSDESVVIDGAEIVINEGYEGIEGKTIDINGGNITLTASDDGLNAAGGNDESGFGGMMGRDDFGASSDSYIKITGGELRIDASGDGVDSNGDLTVTGGKTYVSGPTNGGNGALDYGGNASITGGYFIATGSVGMAQNFGNSSTQGTMLVNVGTSNSIISLCDKKGNVLLSFEPQKSYQCAVISTPDVKVGETYTVKTDSGTVDIEMSSIVYGSTGGMGGPGGGGHGKPGRW